MLAALSVSTEKRLRLGCTVESDLPATDAERVKGHDDQELLSQTGQNADRRDAETQTGRLSCLRSRYRCAHANDDDQTSKDRLPQIRPRMGKIHKTKREILTRKDFNRMMAIFVKEI